ncbi:uncharacterized protein LOC131666612 [Phymastichus coffea]|uniref:uncharacterized protein LOC131666612 n=1 Tax=Phymastichus coffea TaxID=108790 RepID=UPI00273B94F2|nr:uncharacterized protein LOC131666612 [Phymastichus coffea]
MNFEARRERERERERERVERRALPASWEIGSGGNAASRSNVACQPAPRLGERRTDTGSRGDGRAAARSGRCLGYLGQHNSVGGSGEHAAHVSIAGAVGQGTTPGQGRRRRSEDRLAGRARAMLLLVTLAIGSCCLVLGGLAIDCFHCVSVGGDNRDCDDPFHNNGSLGFLQSPCLGGRKGRDGLFPATACVKIAGVYYDSGVSLTVRSCALDSGTLTTDSELIRMSHCGGFYYENRYLKGCVQSCSDADACNRSERQLGRSHRLLVVAAAAAATTAATTAATATWLA